MKLTYSYLTNLLLVVMSCLLLTSCGEEYSPYGDAEALSITVAEINVVKTHNGRYDGSISSNGNDFTFKVTEPNCGWIDLSGRVDNEQSFRLNPDQTFCEGDWGSIRRVTDSHPFGFEVKIAPNNTGKERRITLEYNYGNHFGGFTLTQSSLTEE